MKKWNDLTGKKYGFLNVLSVIGKNEHGDFLYLCVCDCGNETVKTANALTSGNVKSCGCLRKNKYLEQKNSMIGLIFGRLKVNKFYGKDKDGKSLYLCTCECGKEKIVSRKHLLLGYVLSCGCYKSDRAYETNFKDIADKRFGKLIAIKRLEKSESGHYLWFCLCDCGEYCVVSGNNLRRNNTRSCGCLKESYVANELKKYYVKHNMAKIEYRIFKNPKTGYALPYDIYIPNENIYIEINGGQHYEYNDYWHRTLKGFEYNLELDKMKRQYAIKNGFYLEIDLRKIKTVEEAILYVNNFISKIRMERGELY